MIMILIGITTYKANAATKFVVNNPDIDIPKLISVIDDNIRNRESELLIEFANETAYDEISAWDIYNYKYKDIFFMSGHLRSNGKYAFNLESVKPLIFKLRYIYIIDDNQNEMVEKKIDSIISNIIKPEMTELEKEKAVVDWICDNVEYDYDENYYTEYDALFNGKTVCNGYSRLTSRMLDKAGIKNYIVVGKVNNSWKPHAWNLVQIDGKWYILDTTYIDSVKGGFLDELWKDYFNADINSLDDREAWTYAEAADLNGNLIRNLKFDDSHVYRDSMYDVYSYTKFRLLSGYKEIVFYSKDNFIDNLREFQLELANREGLLTYGYDLNIDHVFSDYFKEWVFKYTIKFDKVEKIDLNTNSNEKQQYNNDENMNTLSNNTNKNTDTNINKDSNLDNVDANNNDLSNAKVDKNINNYDVNKVVTTTTTTTNNNIKKNNEIQLIINKKSIILNKGKTYKLSIKGANINNIKWVSSNSKVVSVNNNGVIKGIKKGKATVKAYLTTNPKIFTICNITVK